MVSLDATVRMAGFRRAATMARELARKLDMLADFEQPNDRPRRRVIEPPPPPRGAHEFFAQRARVQQERRGQRYEITQVEPEDDDLPALPDGA